jgi:hypothetical protein
MILMFQGSNHEFIDVTGRCTLLRTQICMRPVTERKVVFQKIIHIKAVKSEGRKGPLS